MNALAPVDPIHLPAISSSLNRIIEAAKPVVFGQRETADERKRREERGDPCPTHVIAGRRIEPNRSEIEEAQRALAFMEPLGHPLPHERVVVEVRRLLQLVNSAVANPQDPKALEMRVASYAMAVEDLPRAVFARETVKAALGRFKFFPAAAELKEFLAEREREVRALQASLRQVASAIPEPVNAPHDDRRDPAQQQAVADLVAAWRGEQAARRAAEADAR